MGNFNRDDRRGSRGNFGRRDFGKRSFGGHGGPREMHKAVCSNCGKECEVPFVPTGAKPVYCSECFEKMGGGANSRRRDFGRRNESRPQNNEQIAAINRKLDKILEMLTPVKVEKVEKGIEAKPEEVVFVAPKKDKTPQKKTPAKKE